MNREQLILGTLLSLFDLANDLGRAGRPEAVRVGRLAGRLGVPPAAVRAALLHLEERGLVDADRARLTLKGLAVAASFRASQRGAVPVAA